MTIQPQSFLSNVCKPQSCFSKVMYVVSFLIIPLYTILLQNLELTLQRSVLSMLCRYSGSCCSRVGDRDEGVEGPFHPASRIPGMASIGISRTPSLKQVNPGCTLRISLCFLSINFLIIYKNYYTCKIYIAFMSIHNKLNSNNPSISSMISRYSQTKDTGVLKL